MDTQEQFWAKVDKSGECWVWTGFRDEHGYGRLTWQGQTKEAHRLVWEFVNGPIPKGMSICHHCDNPPCVHPDHLFQGTPAENSRDMAAKGRHGAWVRPESVRRGEQVNTVKLTEEQVLAIRAAYVPWTNGYGALARAYDMSWEAIRDIVKRKSWTHI